MTLIYWREYRTEFHIGLAYGVSEATVRKTIQKVENVLIKSRQIHLSGKKALEPSKTVIEIVLVDATEQLIERPKKDKAGITVVKRSDTLQKAKLIINQKTNKFWRLIFVVVVSMIFSYSRIVALPSHEKLVF